MELSAEKIRKIDFDKKKCSNCIHMKKINSKEYICVFPIPLGNSKWMFCNDIGLKVK